MNCSGCEKEGIETLWGCVCDGCGGVVVPSPAGPRLLFRHVATVDGAAGRLQIVFDDSTADYAVAYPRKAAALVNCIHCGRETPADPGRERGAGELGMVKRPPVHVTHGTLDAVLYVALGEARGGSAEAPTLSRSAHATEQEKAFLGIA
jgi:hypothetical protein